MPAPLSDALFENEGIKEAAETLDRVQCESFTASPDHISPFQRSVLTWRVTGADTTPGSRLRLQLSWLGSRMTVGAQGSRSVAPIATTGYLLTAHYPPLSKVLCSQRVEVDTDSCKAIGISEHIVSGLIAGAIDDFMDKLNADGNIRFRRKRPESVEIDQSGIHIKVSLEVKLDDLPNPDLYVETTLRLWAENGEPKYALNNYNADLNFPWWADLVILSSLPGWLFSAIADEVVEGTIRHRLATVIEDFLTMLENITGSIGHRILSITTDTDLLNFTICPHDEKDQEVALEAPSIGE